jgi:hypothetical protein
VFLDQLRAVEALAASRGSGVMDIEFADYTYEDLDLLIEDIGPRTLHSVRFRVAYTSTTPAIIVELGHERAGLLLTEQSEFAAEIQRILERRRRRIPGWILGVLRRYSSVHLTTYREHRTWWERNGDKTVGAIGGSVATFIVIVLAALVTGSRA